MGRKSAYKDRAYIRQSEYKTEGYGGATASTSTSTTAPASKLFPWDRCSITGEPWQDPVASFPDGAVFDVTAAVPAIRKSGGKHPLFPNQPLALKDLVRLHYHRIGGGGGEGEDDKQASFGCPVTGKAFTSSSHIVALKPTGNVFAFDAIDRLCLKAKNMKDLLDDTPFTRADIIHLQDPLDVSGKKADMMARAVKKSSSVPETTTTTTSVAEEKNSSSLDASALGKDAQKILARITSSGPGSVAGGRGDRGAGRLLHSLSSQEQQQQNDPRLRAPQRENVAAPAFKPGAATWATDGDNSQLSYQMRKEAERKRKKEEEEEQRRKKKKEKKDGECPSPPKPYGEEPFKRLAAIAAAASRPVAFTSSVTPLNASSTSVHLPQPPKFRKPKAEKGYARVSTTLGDLNLELFADSAPRAVENFIVLANSGYYDGCVFHRSIRNFVLQGGDPTGTGKGGESIYDKGGFPFEDSHRSHDARGVVAMANAGDRNANGSQFYITYRSAPHLDGKHTVFGRVVGGATTTLSEIEKLGTDDNDRPQVAVVIEKVTVFVDPFDGGDDEEEGEGEEEGEEQRVRREAAETREKEEGRKRARWFSGPAPSGSGGGGGGVGRYLAGAVAQQELGRGAAAQQQQRTAPKKSTGGFGDFSSW